MDGDLQNEPEDIPKLLDALDRVDVASGRRVARRDSAGRTVPSRVINGLLRRFTGVDDLRLRLRLQRLPARRDRADARRDRQAEVHEGARRSRRGVTVEEVDVSHAALELRLALLAAPARPARAARRRRLLAAAGAVDRRHARRWSARSRPPRSASTASSTGSRRATSPGRSSRGAGIVLVLGIQGFVLALIGESLGRIQRDVEGRPLYTIEEEL